MAASGATDDEVVSVEISPACRAENHQLRVWGAVIFGWMAVTCVFFAVGWYLNYLRIIKDRKTQKNSRQEDVSSELVENNIK